MNGKLVRRLMASLFLVVFVVSFIAGCTGAKTVSLNRKIERTEGYGHGATIFDCAYFRYEIALDIFEESASGRKWFEEGPGLQGEYRQTFEGKNDAGGMDIDIVLCFFLVDRDSGRALHMSSRYAGSEAASGHFNIPMKSINQGSYDVVMAAVLTSPYGKVVVSAKAEWNVQDSILPSRVHTWTLLMMVCANVKTPDYEASLGEEEYEKILIVAEKFRKFVEAAVPTLDFQFDFVYELDPVTNIHYIEGFGPTIRPEDVITLFEKHNYSAYDSIFAVANMTEFWDDMTYSGLTWPWDFYSLMPYIDNLPERDDGYPWFDNFPEHIYVHEWAHQAEYWYGSLGYDVPVLHDYLAYGYDYTEEYGWDPWLTDYLSGNISGGKYKGIHPDWWQYTPTTWET